MKPRVTYGEIQVPVKGAPVSAVLKDSGWECQEGTLADYLNAFFPPEWSSYLPNPWLKLLREAAKELGGTVVASKEPHPQENGLYH